MVDIRVLRIDLLRQLKVPERQLWVLDGVLALLDVEGGPLDEGVHAHLGVGGLVGGDSVHVGERGGLLLGQDVEGAWKRERGFR